MKKSLILLSTLLIISCATIPKNASVLSASVTQGIERLQTENEKIIKSLADVERAILDESWEDIYNTFESKYRTKYNIASGTILTKNQTIDIATGAAAVREDLLKAISDKENALVLKSKENSQKVISINQEIQNYLLSLKKYDEANQQVNNLTTKIIGVNPSKILGTIDNNLQNTINNYFN
ncbi:hypothetical protein [uncultured Tenacibaculum sp.]|uniref:hypothetical protein n=1 Tax=uncultured Tenacibaculum sp. TaxID=174713 RepID=UPI00261B8AA9|nr:hypothetical protein [uncultured Tenacibaculum sp.]